MCIVQIVASRLNLKRNSGVANSTLKRTHMEELYMNTSYDKYTNTLCCPKCGERKSRTYFKYVKYIFSPYCFAVCRECRDKYQSNTITRFFIRPVE